MGEDSRRGAEARRFARYAAYKDSGIEWLKKIPDHWSVSRIKTLTTTKSGTTPKSGIDVYYDNGVHYWVRTTDLNNGRLCSSEFQVSDIALEHYSLPTIPVNSVLIAMYGGMGTIGKNAILQKEVTINQSVCAILPNEKEFDAFYLWYYLQYFRPHWKVFANSARKDPNINQEAIKRLWVPLPTLHEQRAIAAYLDAKTAAIDRQIELLTRKAAHYADLKQALINRTVTRGLPSTSSGQGSHDVPLKDSGIEWIGQIPAHWEVKRAKDLGLGGLTNGIFKKKDQFGSGVKLVNVIDLYQDNTLVHNDQLGRVNTTQAETRKYAVNSGDIFFVRSSLKLEGIGVSALFEKVEEPTVFECHIIRFRPNSQLIFPKFLIYLLNSEYIRSRFVAISQTVTMTTISQGKIASLELMIPPLAEQRAIAATLDVKTAHIDRVVAAIEAKIERLRELRTTLVNDVVTGKIRVGEYRG